MEKTMDSTAREKAFIDKNREEWKKKSEKYRLLYGEKRNPDVISDFLNASAYAFKEEWVTRSVIQAMHEGRRDFLNKAFSTVRDKRKNKRQVTAMKTLMMVIAVDIQIALGLTRVAAFEKIADLNYKIEQDCSFDRVKNQYYRGKKVEPEIYVEGKGGYRFISVSPTRIGMSGEKLKMAWDTIKHEDPENFPYIKELFMSNTDITCFAGSWEMKTYPNNETKILFSIHWPQKTP